MLEHSKHDHVIELLAPKGQAGCDLGANEGPAAGIRRTWQVIETHPPSDASLYEMKKRSTGSASQIADTGIREDVRQNCTKTAPGNKSIERSISHLVI